MSSKTVHRIEHSIQRAETRLNYLIEREEHLSNHGYWEMGYLQGKIAALDTWLSVELEKEENKNSCEIVQVLD